jgi:glycosyltransferase involved in cell wall biosynthesis
MKEIVLINQSSGFLMVDIANAYATKYEKVVLITGKIQILERPLDKNIEISKIVSYNKKNSFSRIYSWIWGTIQIFWKLLIKYRKGDILFVTNPPLSYVSALFLNRVYSVLIYDIYPDALKNIGISENHLIYKTWVLLNKRIYKRAKKIYTLSEGMATKLSQYVHKDSITVIPNWSGSEKIRPIPKNKNIFIKNKNIENKFIVLYSGNMGYTHNVDVLVDVAKSLINEKNIIFLFIGDGKMKNELISKVKAENLNNCLFFGWQNPDMLPFSLAAADLGVVTLNEETAYLSVPSKTYNLMAAGVALLSISPENSALSDLIKSHQNGRNFSADQVSEISNFILYCRDNRDVLKKMSKKSFEASKNYTFKNASFYV